jgi:Tfp pilus assembly protein PilX
VVAADLPIDSSCGSKRAWRRGLRSVLPRLADERGMTLVMALLMMVVLTSVSTTTIYFVTSNVHSTGISKASTSAYDVAEAGLNDSVAKMYNQLDTDGSILASGIDPRSSTMFPSCVGAPPPAPPTIS